MGRRLKVTDGPQSGDCRMTPARAGACVLCLALLASCALVVLAASSPNYVNDPALFDNGGERATSPNYVQLGSIGGLALGYASSPSYQNGAGTGYTVFGGAGGPAGGDPEGELVAGLGPMYSNGRIEVIDGASGGYAHLAWIQLPWAAYNNQNGLTHPALGDLDGDGKDEIVAGLGPYPQNGGWLAVFDDAGAGHALLRWQRVPWQAYNNANGMSWPACGDLDGDGLDEVVVGLGPYAPNGGWLWLFDDSAAGYASLGWIRVPWMAYNSSSGEARPACGDFDNDTRDELVVGLGQYFAEGWMVLFEDAAAGYAVIQWLRVPWQAYNLDNGETHVAAGEMDGDAADELVAGLGALSSSTEGGWWCYFDDAASGYAFSSWKRLPWRAYCNTGKGTRPAVANVDADAEAETIIGLDRYPSDGGWLCVLGSWSEGLALQAWTRVNWSVYNSTCGETWPAAGDGN